MSPTLATPSPGTIATTLQTLGAQVLLRGWLSANNIVFAAGEDGATVVDTGYHSQAAQTLALRRRQQTPVGDGRASGHQADGRREEVRTHLRGQPLQL